MSDDETRQRLRDAVAGALRPEVRKLLTYPDKADVALSDALADAVLDALDLRAVGWHDGTKHKPLHEHAPDTQASDHDCSPVFVCGVLTREETP